MEILPIAVIVFLSIGSYGLIKTHSELSRICKSWKVVAKARVVGGSFLPIFIVGYSVVIATFVAFEYLFKSRFDPFDLAFPFVMAVLCAFYILNYSRAEIAKEGLILGKWLKICVPWSRVGDVKVEGEIVKTKRHVLKVEEGFENLKFL